MLIINDADPHIADLAIDVRIRKVEVRQVAEPQPSEEGAPETGDSSDE